MWGVAALGWASMIWVLSSLPRLPALPITFPQIDKVAHATVFGVLGALVALALLRGRRWRRAAWVLLLCVAWGGIDELHQAFVPGRTPSWGDLGADALGAALGAVVVIALRRPRGRAPRR